MIPVEKLSWHEFELQRSRALRWFQTVLTSCCCPSAVFQSFSAQVVVKSERVINAALRSCWKSPTGGRTHASFTGRGYMDNFSLFPFSQQEKLLTVWSAALVMSSLPERLWRRVVCDRISLIRAAYRSPTVLPQKLHTFALKIFYCVF